MFYLKTGHHKYAKFGDILSKHLTYRVIEGRLKLYLHTVESNT